MPLDLSDTDREGWKKAYELYFRAFQALFQYHLLTAPTVEEAQGRITADCVANLVNLFVVNAPKKFTERELYSAVWDFTQNMAQTVSLLDLKPVLHTEGQPVVTYSIPLTE
jgi:hypothetical protein